jgi:hypothetical protein
MTDTRGLLADTRAGVERAAVWLVTLAVLAAVVGSVVYVAEDVRREVPDTDFAVSFDGETRTVTVEHDGGEPITDRVTERLVVEVADADGPTTETITWAADIQGPTSRGTGYPVEEGDALAVDDPAVDANEDGNFHDADASVGIRLSESDTVRVVWTGNRQGGPTRTVTLAEATL